MVFVRVESAIQQQSSADIISYQIFRVLFAAVVSNLVVLVNHDIFTDGKISKHDMYIIVRLSFVHCFVHSSASVLLHPLRISQDKQLL